MPFALMVGRPIKKRQPQKKEVGRGGVQQGTKKSREYGDTRVRWVLVFGNCNNENGGGPLRLRVKQKEKVRWSVDQAEWFNVGHDL